MRRYLATRLLSTVPTLLGVITLVFVVMRLVPGTIVDQILANGDSSEEVQRSLRAFFGLDQPDLLQYLKYLGEPAHRRSRRKLAGPLPGHST